jgi:AraC-like DNA-binding protein
MNARFQPCTEPPANRFVKAFWQMHGEPAFQTETILPKGVVELIFSFEEPVVYHMPNQRQSIQTPKCFISGINDYPIQLQAPKKQYFFGVMLRPAAVKKILSAPGGVFINSITDLENVHKDFKELWDLLAEEPSFDKRMFIVQNWILRRAKEVFPQELAISDYLDEPIDIMAVNELANHFCYSSRQLNRKSQEMFGMTTERMLRYKRYLRALSNLHQSQDTLTRIGYESDYFDQAHFNREFKSFTSLTPGEYREHKTGLQGHLYKDVRYVQG